MTDKHQPFAGEHHCKIRNFLHTICINNLEIYMFLKGMTNHHMKPKSKTKVEPYNPLVIY